MEQEGLRDHIRQGHFVRHVDCGSADRERYGHIQQLWLLEQVVSAGRNEVYQLSAGRLHLHNDQEPSVVDISYHCGRGAGKPSHHLHCCSLLLSERAQSAEAEGHLQVVEICRLAHAPKNTHTQYGT